MKIKVLIADDHSIVRAGLISLLKFEKSIDVIGEAKDGLEAYNKTLELLPDVVVMDLSMPPGEFGLITIKRIKEQRPSTKIIILTIMDKTDIVLHALENGANGYILKSADDFELAKAIEKVHRGEYVLSHTKTTMYLIDFYKQNARNVHNFHQLSIREQEILAYIAKGYSNKELSKMLYLSVKTLEAHQARIKKKIGVTTRPELVKYALKNGLLYF